MLTFFAPIDHLSSDIMPSNQILTFQFLMPVSIEMYLPNVSKFQTEQIFPS
jgi:hypothetical protein